MSETQNIINKVVKLVNEIESKSWICNYLQKKGIIDDQEFMILSRFGTWVLEQYPDVMRCYWSYLDKLMKKYDQIETLETSNKLFRPWVDETIRFIKSEQLNRAYFSFCLMVIKLTEKYNKNYLLFTKSELDVYLGLKKSVENTRRYSYNF